MNIIKKIFTTSTGYWIHKVSSLPVGADIFIDIHKRIGYGSLQTMFDVGANIGQTWEWFRRSEAAAKIYCFEPVKDAFIELKKKAGKDANVVFENIAFGEAAGEKTIRLYGHNSSLNSLNDAVMNQDFNSVEEKINIDTLDNYCLKNGIKKIDFLKIDTEGYEMNVLKGAEKMLSENRVSFIYCETGFLKQNKRNTYFADLTEWLAEKDYHFNGLYQLVSNGFSTEFGNALFVHKSIFKS